MTPTPTLFPRIPIRILCVTSLALFTACHAPGNVWEGVKSTSADIVDSLDGTVDDLLAPSTDDTAKIIEKIESYAPDFIEIRRQQAAAPKKAWLGKDKGHYEKKAQEQLAEIRELLFDRKLLSQAERIRERQGDIRALRNEQAALRIRIVDANAVGNTKKASKLEEKVQKIETEDIQAIRDEIEAIKEAIHGKFARLGTALSEEQVDHLCARIDGDDILKSMTMIDIFSQILERTKGYIEADPGNLTHTKRYYGVYVLLAESNVHVKDVYIKKVNRLWMPMLKDFEEQAEEQIARCKAEMKAAGDARIRERFGANLAVNKMSLQAIHLYRDMLADQREKVASTRERAGTEARLAWSTYETASLSSDLIGMINEADRAFHDVMKMEMPDLVPIENSEIQKSFLNLTQRLQGSK